MHDEASSAMSAIALVSIPPRWGLATTLGRVRSRFPGSGGSELKTSSPVPARWPLTRLS